MHPNNTIDKNIADSNSWHGIWSGYSSGNMIANNTASNNPIGIQLGYSNNNTIWGNNFANNSDYQVWADKYSTGNHWYYQHTGNYYSDYQSRYRIATNNGSIWNTPYQIPGVAVIRISIPYVLPMVLLIRVRDLYRVFPLGFLC